MTRLLPEGRIPHIKVRTMEEAERQLRRQTLQRLTNFLGDLHPDSHEAKILCDAWDKQDCTDFGFYVMKYVEEYETEQSHED